MFHHDINSNKGSLLCACYFVLDDFIDLIIATNIAIDLASDPFFINLDFDKVDSRKPTK